MSNLDPVKITNEETSPFFICGLARELHSALIHRVDELNELPRMAVEHYHEEARGTWQPKSGS